MDLRYTQLRASREELPRKRLCDAIRQTEADVARRGRAGEAPQGRGG